MKSKILAVLTALYLAGCASTNKSVDVPITKTEPDYVVKERSAEPAPDWIRDFAGWRKNNDGHGMFYFLGESGDVNDRIAGCDLAKLDGTKKISQELAQLITHKIAQNKQGRLAIDPNDSNDPGMQRAFESNLAGKSMAFLSGVKEYGTFWELRDYSKSGGNKRVFNCSVVVAITEQDMRAALKRGAQKAPEIVEDKQAKEAVTKSMNGLDADFTAYAKGLASGN